MIATRILAPKGGSGFRRLGAYVLNVKGHDDPASWTRLHSYVLDAAHGGEKVAWARVSNCVSTDPGWAVKEIVATQAMNTRAKADKSYHLVVSFAPGERPERAVVEAIEDRLCAAIGFEDHQRVSAVHQNTGLWHLHVAISRVHPKTLHAVHPFRDHYRLQEAVHELEVEHGLTRTAVSRDAREAAANVQQKRTGRAARPVLPDPQHEQFRRDLAAAVAARDKAMKALRIQQAEYARTLSAWHSERLRQEGLLELRGHLRRDGFAHLAEQRRKDRAERLAREQEERRRLLATHPLPSRKDYAAAQLSQAARPEPSQTRGRQTSQEHGR